MNDVQKLTDIDLADLQIGEHLTIYRGSSAFLTGPRAAGYVGDATVTRVTNRSALTEMSPESRDHQGDRFKGPHVLRLRFSDQRICRIPNGEPTMLYVHARSGRPTVTAYFTDDEYVLVKKLLAEEAQTPASPKTHRISLRALERMEYHDRLCGRE
jgi:hypothetical protein